MTIRNIVVPFDFSNYSESALATACDLGSHPEAMLHLVHVVDGDRSAEVECKAAEQLLATFLPNQELHHRIRRKVLFGSVHEELLNYAHEHQVDLIVMGTRGRSGIMQIAIGSVAQRVLRKATCPVVLLNPDSTQNQTIPPEADDKYRALRVENSPALDMVARGLSLRATDIHIDPVDDEQYRVRLRVDGKIVNYCTLDRNISEHLINQYLTLARIDHADPFRPREGRLSLPSSLQDIEVRVTASPVAGGEAVSLRLFTKENVFLPLQQLGFSDQGMSSVGQMLHGNEGLILITGPTGSGKTTTVYSMLETFGGRNRNIVSIEDPVEFSVPWMRQLNVDERHGVTFTSGLRTILRMDPDIVLLGEIRDPENAEIALRAAGSGRFVFSSLHTRDVASTITTIRDFNIANHSIAGNLIGIVNQRLVRKLCLQCRRAVAIPTACREMFAEYHIEPPVVIFEPVGCDACRGTGFLGRSGVFETVVFDRELAKAIEENASEADIRRIIRSNTASLTEDSLRKVSDGVTGFDEARSVRWL